MHRVRFFENNRIVFFRYDEVVLFNGTYQIQKNNDIEFIVINWDNNDRETYLVLLDNGGRIVFLYKGDTKPIFELHYFDDSDDVDGYFARRYLPESISASSYLVESNIEYTPHNMGTFAIGRPWVEGALGQGTGEKIIISGDTTGYNFLPLDLSYAIHISLGYVSYSKPYLYHENSRPKKIKINTWNTSYIVDLKDTPHFQIIVFDHSLGYYGDEQSSSFEIEILEVYPGTKYQDTCINTLIVEWSQ
jgi:hypothetical protein